MKRVRAFVLFFLLLFSFVACTVEESDASCSFTVLYPSENSAHGYQISDLDSCKLEVFNSIGESYIYTASFNSPILVSSLKKGRFIVRAYGYDSFGSSIALSGVESYSTEDNSVSSEKLQLEWCESGKAQDEFCVVRFDTDGGSILKQQLVKAGSPLAEVPSASKSGYLLKGWYWNSARTYEFDFSEGISCNLTLHATWELAPDAPVDPDNPAEVETKYTVTFHKNDGSGDEETFSWEVEEGMAISLPDSNMFSSVSEGVYLRGWAESAGDTVPASYDYVEIYENRDFYALWTSESCTLTFVNTFNPSEKITKKVGKDLKLDVHSQFDWINDFASIPQDYRQVMLSYSYPFDEEEGFIYELVTVSSDQTYYVYWVYYIFCHLGYTDDSGNEPCFGMHVRYGEREPEASFDSQRNGYELEGWYMDEGLTIRANLAALSAADCDEGGTLHLYAKWTERAALSGITIKMESVGESSALGLSLSGSTFTATGGFASYVWRLDGSKLSATGSTCTIDTASLEAGVYSIVVLATDSDGRIYSATAKITVEKE